MGRRKPGALLPIEVRILEAGLEMRAGGDDEFHGFALAKRMSHGSAKRLTSHGTLYKALGRLEEAGLLSSRWEDAARSLAEGRPRRRLYTVTGLGERRLAAWRRDRDARPAPPRAAWEVGG